MVITLIIAIAAVVGACALLLQHHGSARMAHAHEMAKHHEATLQAEHARWVEMRGIEARASEDKEVALAHFAAEKAASEERMAEAQRQTMAMTRRY